MALADDLLRIAAAQDESVTGVLAAELADGTRVYLCAYESGAWLAFDAEAKPIESRRIVREAASLSALCEVAEEIARIEGTEPRLATNAYLDEIGAAGGPEFAAAFQQAAPAIEELVAEIERSYKLPLS